MPFRAEFDSGFDPGATWGSILQAWVCALVGNLNRNMQRGDYRADADVQTEIGLLEELRERPAPVVWALSPAVLPDRYHVSVCEPWNAICPCGVVAFVTPRIKAHAAKRKMFVHRCLGSLSNATGLVVVDVIPGSEPSPLGELAEACGFGFSIPPSAALSFRAAAYRDEHLERHVWVRPIVVGEAIRPVPLALRGGPVLLLDLEATFTVALEATGL